jgi:V8-like Glu-specific endopeptidase
MECPLPKLTPTQQTELLDVLLEFPGTRNPEQRDALLFSLPPQITDSINLSNDRYAAIVKLVETLEFWGQLADGRWATEVMLRNALRAAKSTQFEQRFEAIRQTFELPAAKVQLAELPEQIASEISYLMPVGFLDDGQRAARAVARICVPQIFDGKPRIVGSKPGLALGTGWLITPNLLVTNHHVVAARFAGEAPVTASDIAMQATGAQAWFDYVDVNKPYHVYPIMALEASDKVLDYAVLRVGGTGVADPKLLSDWGHLRIAPETDELRVGRPLNIIQHPSGDVKHIAIRRNDCVGIKDDNEFCYLTDTLPGSSGSPVFNDDWFVVGLHRASQMLPEKVYLKGETIKYNNLGIRIHAILRHLPAALRAEIAAAQ